MIHFKLTLKILDYTKTFPIKTNVIFSLISFLLDSISELEILYSPVFSTSNYLLEFLIFNHCEMIVSPFFRQSHVVKASLELTM